MQLLSKHLPYLLNEFNSDTHQFAKNEWCGVKANSYFARARAQNQNHFDTNISIHINIQARVKYELAKRG